jgi:hypothetical protein
MASRDFSHASTNVSAATRPGSAISAIPTRTERRSSSGSNSAYPSRTARLTRTQSNCPGSWGSVANSPCGSPRRSFRFRKTSLGNPARPRSNPSTERRSALVAPQCPADAAAQLEGRAACSSTEQLARTIDDGHQPSMASARQDENLRE